MRRRPKTIAKAKDGPARPTDQEVEEGPCKEAVARNGGGTTIVRGTYAGEGVGSITSEENERAEDDRMGIKIY
jgi:hypothetical protein